MGTASRTRRSLTRDVENTIVFIIVNTRLDCCNSILFGAAESSLEKLQRLPLAAYSQSDIFQGRDDVFQGTAKRAARLLARCAASICTDTYIAFVRHAVANSTKFQDEVSRSTVFSCSGPIKWNSLPPNIRNCDNIYTFKTQLTIYFSRRDVTLTDWR